MQDQTECVSRIFRDEELIEEARALIKEKSVVCPSCKKGKIIATRVKKWRKRDEREYLTSPSDPKKVMVDEHTRGMEVEVMCVNYSCHYGAFNVDENGVVLGV